MEPPGRGLVVRTSSPRDGSRRLGTRRSDWGSLGAFAPGSTNGPPPLAAGDGVVRGRRPLPGRTVSPAIQPLSIYLYPRRLRRHTLTKAVPSGRTRARRDPRSARPGPGRALFSTDAAMGTRQTRRLGVDDDGITRAAGAASAVPRVVRDIDRDADAAGSDDPATARTDGVTAR